MNNEDFHKDDGIKLYEIILWVCYKVRGKEIAEVKNTNQMLRRFRRVLEEVKVKRGTLEAHVVSAENFQSQRKDLSSLTCSNQLKFSVSDDKKNYASNRNNVIEGLIHTALLKLKINGNFNGSEYRINVLDTASAGEFREGHWPMEEDKRRI